MFNNRKLVIATKHEKEIVFAPLFEKQLGVKCVVDTDTNFNGEEIKSEKQLIDFATKVNFPSHALIIRKARND